MAQDKRMEMVMLLEHATRHADEQGRMDAPGTLGVLTRYFLHREPKNQSCWTCVVRDLKACGKAAALVLSEVVSERAPQMLPAEPAEAPAEVMAPNGNVIKTTNKRKKKSDG